MLVDPSNLRSVFFDLSRDLLEEYSERVSAAEAKDKKNRGESEQEKEARESEKNNKEGNEGKDSEKNKEAKGKEGKATDQKAAKEVANEKTETKLSELDFNKLAAIITRATAGIGILDPFFRTSLCRISTSTRLQTQEALG